MIQTNSYVHGNMEMPMNTQALSLNENILLKELNPIVFNPGIFEAWKGMNTQKEDQTGNVKFIVFALHEADTDFREPFWLIPWAQVCVCSFLWKTHQNPF